MSKYVDPTTGKPLVEIKPKPTTTKIVSLQEQLDVIQQVADTVLKDFEKLDISTSEIKASQKEIRDITQRLEAGILSASNIEQIKREIEETKTRIQETARRRPIPPSQREVTTLVDRANVLYTEAGFTEKTRLGQIPERPTSKQAKARLGLFLIEPFIGGVQEAIFPFGIGMGKDRPATSVLRIAGAVATPTAADFVASWVLAKTGVTAAGRRLLKKMEKYLLNIGDPIFPKLTPDELDIVRQWEKMGHTPTSLRRSAQVNPNIFKTIEEMSEYYRKYPAQFSSGASVIPEPVFIFNKIAYDIDMDAYDLVNFINKNDGLFADGTLLAALIPTLSPADAIIVIEGTTLIPEPEIDDLVERMREETWSRQTPTLDDETALAPPIVEPIIDVPEDVPPVEAPPIVEPILDVPEDTALIVEPIIDVPEDAPPDEPVPTPLVPFLLKSKKRKAINLKLFRGPKRKYRVQHKYIDGTKTTITVPAQSIPEAVAKAEGTRNRNKRLKETIIEEA